MKILYISHSHPPRHALLENIGGMQRVSMQLVNELQNRNDVQLYSIVLETAWERHGPRTLLFLLKLLVDIPVKVKKLKPDVVLFSSMVTASLSFFLRNLIPVPMVTINHGQDVTLPVPLYQRFLPKVFRSLDGVISVSGATRDASIQRGLEPGKGVALPNGYPARESVYAIPREDARRYLSQHFNIDFQDRKVLVSVGRQVKRKGHYWFIDKVLPKINTEIVYILMGDGPEHENIKEIVDERHFDFKVKLLGKQSDKVLHNLYAAADLFIMPNINIPGDMEGFGIVLLEANMHGVPFIASRMEGITDVLSEGVNGYGISGGDYNAFAGKIDQLLSRDLKEISMTCRAYVKNKYDWKVVAGQYMSYLNRVVRSHRQDH